VLAQPKSDWERQEEDRNWRELEIALPAAPKPADRLPFELDSPNEFRFYVDRPSIAVGADGVVRYTLVAVSPNGAETVAHQGVRCKSAEVKTYALLRADGSWARRESAWQHARKGTVRRWSEVLRAEYFCPQGVPIANAAEGVDALRRGGHPNKGHISRD